MCLVPIILYCLFIGNLTTPIMNRLSPLSSRLSFPWDWVAFLIFFAPYVGCDHVVDGGDQYATCWELDTADPRIVRIHCNFGYSALACFRMGMSGSASL